MIVTKPRKVILGLVATLVFVFYGKFLISILSDSVAIAYMEGGFYFAPLLVGLYAAISFNLIGSGLRNNLFFFTVFVPISLLSYGALSFIGILLHDLVMRW